MIRKNINPKIQGITEPFSDLPRLQLEYGGKQEVFQAKNFEGISMLGLLREKEKVFAAVSVQVLRCTIKTDK